MQMIENQTSNKYCTLYAFQLRGSPMIIKMIIKMHRKRGSHGAEKRRARHAGKSGGSGGAHA